MLKVCRKVTSGHRGAPAWKTTPAGLLSLPGDFCVLVHHPGTHQVPGDKVNIVDLDESVQAPGPHLL